MREQLIANADGAILFDAEASSQVDARWFDADDWRAQGALREQAGGRGGVQIVSTPAGACVLRHYRRGGFVARVLGDRYLWRGADATRCFAELRLLGAIAQLGLPGPAPVAARYVRSGLYYRADLLTRQIPETQTLAQCLAADRLDATLARAVGAVIARFHRAGIWHADLNAHNVLVSPQGVYLIDFDRGRQRAQSAGWRRANLQRLHRSLVKLGATAADEAVFDATFWQPLMSAYEAGCRA